MSFAGLSIGRCTASVHESMISPGKILCACLLLSAVALVGCSFKDGLPKMPKMPKMGKSEPKVPGHVGAAGTGSYLFYQNCSKCHGDPPSSSFTGMMKDVATITDPRRVKSLDQDWVFQIISDGGSSVGRRSSMPSFKDVLTESEIRRIISYLNGNPF